MAARKTIFIIIIHDATSQNYFNPYQKTGLVL